MFDSNSTQSLAADTRRAGLVVGLRSTRDGTQYPLSTEARRWVIGSGDERMAAAMKRLYQRGRIGPLWELLVSA